MNTLNATKRLREILRRQHKAIATEDTYVYWLRQYMVFIARLPDTLPSEQKLERFLTHLACQRNVSASSQNQALNALVFFYQEVLGQPIQGLDALRAKRPATMRHAPNVADTYALLRTVPDVGGYPTNLVARLLYGCGLRVSEPLNLRIKDVDCQRLRLKGLLAGSNLL